mgnify:CR=1 FL=1
MILENLRMVAYAMIILSSFLAFIAGIHSAFLLLGDIIFSVFAILALLHVQVGGERAILNSVFITPGVFIWSIFHFVNLLKINNETDNIGKERGRGHKNTS